MKAKKFKTLKELFSDKSRWCQGSYAAYMAKNKEGKKYHKSVTASHPKAEMFCLLGGVRKVYPPKKRTDIEIKLLDAIQEIDGYANGIASWNDEEYRKYRDIKKVVRMAGV